MRMRKRSLSCILVILLLLSLAVPAMAASLQLTFKAPDSLPAVGQSFSVTVEIAENPGICTAQLTLHYDKNIVECTDVTFGNALKGMLSVSNPDAKAGAKIACASATPVSRNGVVAEYTFTVLKSGSPGFSLVDVIMNDALGNELSCYISGLEQGSGQEQNQETGNGGKPSVQPKPSDSVFADTGTHWCRDYATKAAALGLFKGYPDGGFHPDENITRAQFVTVLYRMSGSPKVTSSAPFTDIAGQSAEFKTAIAWAYSGKLINGRSEKSFDPGAPITRQEAMKVLFGYAGGQSGMELMFTSIYDSAFTDSGNIAAWAKPAVYWAYYHELITGTSDTTLSPTGLASRGQLAKILVNYSEKFGN